MAAPVYSVSTQEEALILVNAAVLGVVPRLIRPLQTGELSSLIRHGAVFIFSSQESGIQDWIDGLNWATTRIEGNFMVHFLGYPAEEDYKSDLWC
ncbi:Gti1/Pac2 family-domain-containing protein [Mycena olivaceomarginata]|nr:Gti1/Pac2 family-domain-containing protein [Mycena olivaceomarginata]